MYGDVVHLEFVAKCFSEAWVVEMQGSGWVQASAWMMKDGLTANGILCWRIGRVADKG